MSAAAVRSSRRWTDRQTTQRARVQRLARASSRDRRAHAESVLDGCRRPAASRGTAKHRRPTRAGANLIRRFGRSGADVRGARHASGTAADARTRRTLMIATISQRSQRVDVSAVTQRRLRADAKHDYSRKK